MGISRRDSDEVFHRSSVKGNVGIVTCYDKLEMFSFCKCEYFQTMLRCLIFSLATEGHPLGQVTLIGGFVIFL